MRIKSTFKDYYDGCLAYDQEATPLYVRRTKTEPASLPDYHHSSIGGAGPASIWIEPFVIGVGNFVRRGLKLNEGMKREAFCYEPKHAEGFIAASSREARRAWERGGKYKWNAAPQKKVLAFFNPPPERKPPKNISTATMPIWVTIRGGAAFNYKCVLVSNPRLASYDFAKVLPPYEAYQELHTYLCNQAAPQEYIPPVSDADMLEAKGFDPKTSFRSVKPGGPARKQRKKNRRS